MADALSSEQTAYVSKWLDSHWPKGCPGCGSKKFVLQAYLTLPVQKQAMPPTDTVSFAVAQREAFLPFAAAECQDCGLTSFVNLITVGVLLPSVITQITPQGITQSLQPAQLLPPAAVAPAVPTPAAAPAPAP